MVEIEWYCIQVRSKFGPAIADWKWAWVTRNDVIKLQTHQWEEHLSNGLKCSLCQGRLHAGYTLGGLLEKRKQSYLYYGSVLRCDEVLMERICE